MALLAKIYSTTILTNMRIYESLDKFKKLAGATVTIGTFDGVHIGHQQLLHHLKTCATKAGNEVVLITFWPHPRIVLAHTHATPIRILTTFEEKAAVLAQHGVDHLLKLPFNKAFAQLSAQDFIQQILLQQIGMTQVVVGYNHSFGKDRTGNIELLKKAGSEHGFTVEAVAPVMIDNVRVSSSTIRKLLLAGDIAKANKYLGRPYEITCAIINSHLAQEGGVRAQLATQASHKLIPITGVYAVSIHYQGSCYQGKLYISKDGAMEVHIPQLEQAFQCHDLRMHFQE
jgi:riboflavin kinase/FMN adenylyltransferase